VEILTLDDSSLSKMGELAGWVAVVYRALQDNRISLPFRKAILQAMRIA
jgi:hypothetical protein